MRSNLIGELREQFNLTDRLLENFEKSSNELDKMYLLILLSSAYALYMIYK
jgi:hypothetical protein